MTGVRTRVFEIVNYINMVSKMLCQRFCSFLGEKKVELYGDAQMVPCVHLVRTDGPQFETSCMIEL